ncbi:MAG: Xylose isomerase-like barrel, partial [Bryobacterales bacterium]|nr:Xylose isomerase-like barrel [Bryobacterales bacterium]
EYLGELLECCRQIGVQTLVLPLFEASELSRSDVRRMIAPLRRVTDAAGSCGVTVAIETSLDAGALLRLLGLIAHPRLRVCYDTGNSAALGHDVARDIQRLGSSIAHVHVKDKNAEGANVPLGSGISPLRDALIAFEEVRYEGLMTFETVRGDDPLATAKNNVRLTGTLVQWDTEFMVPRLCSAIHEAWVRGKRRQGYRPGPRVDDEAKLHPAIRPFAKLSPESVALESAVVRGLLASAAEIGYQPVRGRRSAECSVLLTALTRRAHDLWLAHQRSLGVQYGPVTDGDLRTHRDMLPFDRISSEKNELDRCVALGLVEAMARAGFRFQRAHSAEGGKL